MTRTLIPLTHVGWFGYCPVKIGLVDTFAPIVVPRWFWCEPLFWISEVHESLVIGLRSVFMPHVEPVFAIRITGKLDPVEMHEIPDDA